LEKLVMPLEFVAPPATLEGSATALLWPTPVRSVLATATLPLQLMMRARLAPMVLFLMLALQLV
tara:strand:- start:4386 stop:4577 length:192 start_codon:yes stop_codon:yes gene_type:complete